MKQTRLTLGYAIIEQLFLNKNVRKFKTNETGMITKKKNSEKISVAIAIYCCPENVLNRGQRF